METLPTHDDLAMAADKCVNVLENELSAPYRCGSLLDFMGEEARPLVVVPDLHARAYFLRAIMDYTLPEDFVRGGRTTKQALYEGAVRVVCVGDALHSESRGIERWRAAWNETLDGVADGNAMREEMAEGLTLLMDVMRYKAAFPESFHFLKGNHENIRNRRGGGDFPFCKFTDEGEMTRQFMCTVYGEDVLYLLGCFEDALPLMAAFDNCVISHAEPARAFSREEIVNARNDDDVVCALTWTANDEAENGSVAAVMKALGVKKGARYITGHRPVKGKYSLRQGGALVQIHNPDTEQVVLVKTGKMLNPETDIVVIAGA